MILRVFGFGDAVVIVEDGPAARPVTHMDGRVLVITEATEQSVRSWFETLKRTHGGREYVGVRFTFEDEYPADPFEPGPHEGSLHVRADGSLDLDALEWTEPQGRKIIL